MSCKSTSSIILDLWKAYGDLATKVGCAAAGVVARDPMLIIKCIEKVKKTEEIITNLISKWNQFAGNSWAKIGPRKLKLGSSETGTITGAGDRTFITPAPFNCNIVKLTLNEIDGKGETDVEICLVNTSGKCTKVKSYSFNDNKAGKRGTGKVEPVIENARGKYLVVVLNGKSVANKFKYKIKLEKVETSNVVKV